MSDLDFDFEKKRFMRMAKAVSAAESPAHLRALMLADTEAPWHSFDMLSLLTETECIGIGLAELMSVGLDEEGVPA